MTNTTVAGILYGIDGKKIQELEAQFIEWTNNFNIAKRMLRTKLEQLAVIDEAIKYAQENLYPLIAEEKITEKQYHNVVGCPDDEIVPDTKFSLWEMHKQIDLEINGDSRGADYYQTSSQVDSWRENGLAAYTQECLENINTLSADIWKYISELNGHSGSNTPGDDTSTDQLFINKLIKKLNNLLASVTDADGNPLLPFDPSAVEFEAEDFDIREDEFDKVQHDHNEEIDAEDKNSFSDEVEHPANPKEEAEVEPQPEEGPQASEQLPA